MNFGRGRNVCVYRLGWHGGVTGQAVKSPVSSQRLIWTVAKQWRLVIVCRPDIETSKVSALLCGAPADMEFGAF